MWDTPAAEIGHKATQDQQHRYHPGRLEQKESNDHADQQYHPGDRIMDGDLERLLYRQTEKTNRHRSGKSEQRSICKRKKREQTHQKTSRQGPYDQREHRQDNTAPLVTDQGKCLCGRGAG